jgi:hypothetical protein
VTVTVTAIERRVDGEKERESTERVGWVGRIGNNNSYTQNTQTHL